MCINTLYAYVCYRYGEDLTDAELQVKAREEMVGRMQQQLKDEGVDVNGVTEVMEEMSRRNRELFKLPPYVLYVSRAFSTLEGIGLSVNPDYSILQECYPYLSQRLMTDNSPRAKQALRSMLLGSGPILSPVKLLEMSDGFSSYTEATTNAAAATGGPSSGVLADQEGKKIASVALAKLLLSPSGNFIQDILVEGVTKTADALVRDRIHKAETSLPGRLLRILVKTPHTVANRFIPAALRPLATPLTLPYDVLSSLSALTKQGQEDQSVLDRISGFETLATTPTSTTASSNGAIPTYVPIPTAPTSSPSISTGEPQNPGISFDRITKELRDPQSPVRTLLQDEEIRQMLPSSTTNITRKLLSSLFIRAADRVDLTLKEHSSSKNQHNMGNSDMNSRMNSDGANGGSGGSEREEEVNMEVLKSIGTLTSSSARQIAKLISPTPTTTTSVESN